MNSSQKRANLHLYKRSLIGKLLALCLALDKVRAGNSNPRCRIQTTPNKGSERTALLANRITIYKRF